MTELDAGWCAAHPLPMPTGETSKHSRGRVLAVGGSRRVPGALVLTGEAALRVGAGKVRLATVGAAAMALGAAFPEAGMIELAEDAKGNPVPDAAALAQSAAGAQAIVLGPGIGDRGAGARLVEAFAALDTGNATLVLDAAAVACAGPLAELLGGHAGRLVMTPHAGEMAALIGCPAEAVQADPGGCAATAARRFGAVVVMKGVETVIAAPGGERLHYAGGGVGLGTSGSGDVLAGVVAGLAARGIAPLEAAAWGVWLHGQAGRALADRVGPLGFLAREIAGELPRLLAAG